MKNIRTCVLMSSKCLLGKIFWIVLLYRKTNEHFTSNIWKQKQLHHPNSNTLDYYFSSLHLRKLCRKDMKCAKMRRVSVRIGNCAEFYSVMSLIKHRLFAARNSRQKLIPLLRHNFFKIFAKSLIKSIGRTPWWKTLIM